MAALSKISAAWILIMTVRMVFVNLIVALGPKVSSALTKLEEGSQSQGEPWSARSTNYSDLWVLERHLALKCRWRAILFNPHLARWWKSKLLRLPPEVGQHRSWSQFSGILSWASNLQSIIACCSHQGLSSHSSRWHERHCCRSLGYALGLWGAPHCWTLLALWSRRLLGLS